MFGRQFYHESLRKIVVAFGTIFNNIVIVRQDSDGGTIQRLKVPLAYSPKEKFLTRLEQQPNLDQREMAISLPRMGFEISGLSYDSSRKLQRVGKFKNVNTSDAGKQYYQYNPVPYNLSFNLYSFTATADSVDYQDTYDGSFTNRRAVNYTMNFTAKTYLYGPIYSSKVIKETQTDIYTDTTGSPKREERIVVVPNPTTADADDDFGFTTTISTYTDSKNYNPSTDSDA